MDTNPPREIKLDAPERRGTPAVSTKILYLGIAVLVFVFCAFIYGLKDRVFDRQKAQVAGSRSEPPGPAVSNRPMVPQHPDAPPKPTAPVIGFQPDMNSLMDLAKSGSQEDPDQSLELKSRQAATTVRFTDSASMNPAPANMTSPSIPTRLVSMNAPASQETASGAGPISSDVSQQLGAASLHLPDTPQASLSRKEKFADGDPSAAIVERVPPVNEFEVMRGAKILAGLSKDVNSQLPGQIEATVRQNVYNSFCGQTALEDGQRHCYVEIPKGSTLIGTYNTEVSYGQNRLQVVWTRLIFPDTSWIDLGRMSGYSADGGAGLKDKVDNHWKRLIGGALLTSTLSAGLAISQNRTSTNSTLSYPSNSQVASAAIGQGGAQLGQELTRQNINIPPVVKLRIGLTFNVDTNRDLAFDGPYRPIR